MTLCSICGSELEPLGFVFTLLRHSATFTACLHMGCCRSALGETVTRRLSKICVDGGYFQTSLPEPRQ